MCSELKMAESIGVVSGEANQAASQVSVVAPPKFVFGQNMSDRIKSANVPSDDSGQENLAEPLESKSDTGQEIGSTTFKRSADYDAEDDKQDTTEEGEPLPPVKKVAKLLKDDEEPKPFMLKPSILNEVAKNLAGSSAKGENRTLTSPVPKTFGLSTSEATSTEDRTGASSPAEPLADKTKNYFQMFLNQQNESPDGPNHGSFVFGRNMGERVMFSTAAEKKKSEENNDHFEPKPEAESSQDSISSGEVIEPKTLAEVAESFAEAAGPKSPNSSPDKRHLSLAEAALVYQETVIPPKSQLAQVPVVTGEEEERNVLQINCRLFLFDVFNRNWKEKGRGVLRLNDMCQSMSESIFQSRLVMRTQGNLRVMLNTKLWPEMTMDRANEKSLRITAMDVTNDLKIYLIMAGPKDIQQLFTAIDRRIQALKRGQDALPSGKPSQTDNESPEQPIKNDKGDADTEEDIDNSKDRRIATPDESSNDSCPGPCDAANKEASSDDE